MSHTYARSEVGRLYLLANNTQVYYPLELDAVGFPFESNYVRRVRSGDLGLVVANELSIQRLDWSLILYVDGTLEHPVPRLGWIRNSYLRSLDD